MSLCANENEEVIESAEDISLPRRVRPKNPQHWQQSEIAPLNLKRRCDLLIRHDPLAPAALGGLALRCRDGAEGDRLLNGAIVLNGEIDKHGFKPQIALFA